MPHKVHGNLSFLYKGELWRRVITLDGFKTSVTILRIVFLQEQPKIPSSCKASSRNFSRVTSIAVDLMALSKCNFTRWLNPKFKFRTLYQLIQLDSRFEKGVQWKNSNCNSWTIIGSLYNYWVSVKSFHLKNFNDEPSQVHSLNGI